MPSSPNGPCRIGSATSIWPRAAAGAESATTGSVSTLVPVGALRARSGSRGAELPAAGPPDLDRRRLVARRGRAPRAPSARRRRRCRARSSARPRSRRRVCAARSVATACVVVRRPWSSPRRSARRRASRASSAPPATPPAGSCAVDDAVRATGRSCPRATSRTRKPAFSSVACATVTSWNVTSGTAAVGRAPARPRASRSSPSSSPTRRSGPGRRRCPWRDRRRRRRGDTPKPALWSSDAAWSYGRPTTFGTLTGRGPVETLIRHARALDDDGARLGRCAVTVPASRSELTSTTCASSPASVSSATALSRVWPTTLGIVTSGLPEETSIETLVPSSTRGALGRVLREDDALLDVRVRDAAGRAGRGPRR